MKTRLFLLLALAQCGAPQNPATRPFHERFERSPYTVVVFTSAKCGCLTAHDERLQKLATSYAARGVQFLGVDSEVGATPENVVEEQRAHGLPFPVLVDQGARLAEELGAEYATYTVIVDRSGRILYRGGFDSDRAKLHDDATHYVRDALDDLLAGHEPRRREAATLGCVLRRW